MSRNYENIKLAIDYIEDHLTEKLNLSIVSNAVHYSKYYLHRLFTNIVGMTMHDYIQRRKLTEAAKLLVFSDKPILEIALIAGYESQQSFTSIFKEMYKKSPNQFRQHEIFYPLQLKFVLKMNPIEIDSKKIDVERDILFATLDDIEIWMDLVRLVVDGFPYLIEDDYLKVLKQCIIDQRALIIKDKKIAIGIMIFSYDTGSIDFLGIHPQYRKQGVAKAFLKKVIKEYLKGKEISITTFREGDKADTGYREIYKNLGFAESELLIEFGYPTQKFVLPLSIKGVRNHE
ncbi:GNAT family N-acetyltransferase [Anaerovorax sp. IOR16]|uniref:GNAT family N-acetyltransferase n=1 Tax=Anaerovorax sp. IOR16 TaxID=2773458 RepID=UPI0019D2A068|nr:GNAT family N-acetyltransferase [Anaerovorax sp. IOR16]